jgi:WD40 repeat protein
VRLVDVATRNPTASFDTDQRGPVDLAFSSDGRAVVTTSEDTTVRLWDAQSGEARSPVLREHSFPVRARTFSDDGRLLATADVGGHGLIWDTATGGLLSRLPHKLVLYAVGLDFSSDSSRIVLSGIFETTVLGVTDGGRSVAPEFSVAGSSRRVAFSADGALLAVARADDRLVDVWDVAARRLRHSLTFPGANDFAALSFSPAGGTLAAGRTDGTTVVWNPESGQAVGEPLAGLRGAVDHVAIDSETSRITTASVTGVASWDLSGSALSRRRVLGPIVAAAPVAEPVASSPDGERVATVGPEGDVAIRDAITLERRGTPIPTASPSLFGGVIAFSPDGRVLVAGTGASVSVVDARTGTVDRPALDMGAYLADLEFSRDGKLLAVGTVEGTALLVDVERWSVRRRVAVSETDATGVTSAEIPGREIGVALSPDGARLATVDNEGRVVLHGVSGDDRTTLVTAKGPAFAAAFSADGRYLATGFADGTALVIDVQGGRSAPLALVGHAGQISDVAFSPGDDVLAVASRGGITLWDVETQQRITELVAPSAPYELAFSPDGLSLATTWYDHSLIVWQLDPRAWQRRACAIAGRNLTRAEWDQYVGDEPYRRTCSQWPEG